MATTTNYSWTTPDNTAYVKDGASAIRTLGSSVDTTLFTALGGAYPGLRLIKKQTIGTGVSSVAVTSAFSATYENYLIVVSGGASSSNGAMNLQFTGGTTAYYWGMSYLSYGNNSPLGLTNSNAGNFGYVGFANVNGLTASINVNSPFLTKYTTITAGVPSETYAGQTNGVQRANTSYTGFSLIHDVGGGTFTGGTIYVYGYGAS